jgi:hypothetical protein
VLVAQRALNVLLFPANWLLLRATILQPCGLDQGTGTNRRIPLRFPILRRAQEAWARGGKGGVPVGVQGGIPESRFGGMSQKLAANTALTFSNVSKALSTIASAAGQQTLRRHLPVMLGLPSLTWHDLAADWPAKTSPRRRKMQSCVERRTPQQLLIFVALFRDRDAAGG